MLTNALQNSGCFSVLLSLKDMKGVEGENFVNLSGAVAAPTESGQYKGTQVTVIGKVIEYRDPESANAPVGNFSVAVANNAHIGFIIQLINTNTREIIDSKQFSVDGKKIIGLGVFTKRLKLDSKSDGHKSFQDAEDKGIMQAVQYIASRKDQMPMPGANSGTLEVKSFSSANCGVLRSGYIPKVMVIIPEFHITQILPDPAGETEVVRKFIDAGFRVVDPALYAALQKTMQFDEAAKDPMKAIALGKKFGADIVIYGEAFSERAGTIGTQISCRARVEAKSVRTDDATIIATNGFEAGAVDNGEFVAGKAALRKAGTMVADYMLTQFCSKDLSFAKSGSSAVGRSLLNSVEITVSNTDYAKLKLLADNLAMKGKVIERGLSDGTGNIKFQYKGSIDDIADYISGKLGTKFSIKDVGDGKIALVGK